MFAERDAALRRALEFCKSYVPSRPTERVSAGGSYRIGRTTAVDVRVIKADTLEVALALPDPDPLVLILADADRPGGCVFAGAGMQEESLFRRTALFAHLPQTLYPIAPDEALYAPDVPVLSSLSGREMRRMAFIACPGIKMPSLEAGNTRLGAEDAATLERKIRLILQVASNRGHRSVVLGALGCGAWGCPRRHVAEIFGQVLKDEGQPCPPTVRFAITGAGAAVFSDALGCSLVLA